MAGTGRSDLGNDRLALIGKIDYPNEKWDIRLWFRRAGRDFDPSLGFVPRRAMQRVNPAISNRTLFARGPIQEMSMGINPIVTLDLHGTWETYERAITAVNWRFRSGDRVQVTIIPSGDRPGQPFQVSPNVVITPAGVHMGTATGRFTTAQKRPLSVSLTRDLGTLLRRGSRGVEHLAGVESDPLVHLESPASDTPARFRAARSRST